MKKLFFVFAAAIMVFAACSPKEDTKKVYQPAWFASFGFTAADNSGVVPFDQIVEKPSAGKVSFSLPVGTPANALKSLKPVFEVAVPETEKTVPVVKVGDQVVESGDAIDFSSVVDFVITVGDVNTLYSVEVKVKNAPSWAKIASSDSTVYNTAPYLEVNPVSGDPVVVTQNTYGTRNVFAFKPEGAKLVSLTSSAYISDNGGRDCTVAFDPDGTPYIAYYDCKEGTSATTLKVSVKKVVASGAEYVGNQCDIYTPETGFQVIFPFAPNNIYVAGSTRQSGATRRSLNVAQWDGTAWTNGISIAERPVTKRGYYNYSAFAKDAAYLMTFNNETSGAHAMDIYKYSNNAWSVVKEGFAPKKTTDQTVIGTIYTTNQCIAADDNGNIYVSLGADYDGTGYTLGVTRISAKDTTLIGGVISNASIATSTQSSVAVDALGTPYVVYFNKESKVVITWIDSATKAWAAPVVLAEDASKISEIKFNKDGRGFIAVKNEGGKLDLYATAE